MDIWISNVCFHFRFCWRVLYLNSTHETVFCKDLEDPRTQSPHYNQTTNEQSKRWPSVERVVIPE